MRWTRALPALLALVEVLALAGGAAAGGVPRGVAVAPSEPPAEPVGSAVRAEEACAEAVARRVQAYYDGVRDLEADFHQTTRSAAFGQASGLDAPAAGRVAFAKPGKMRWVYREPEPSEVVSDGDTLWIYDPRAKEVQVLEVGRAFLSAAAIQFLLGSGRILESFEVQATGCGGSEIGLRLLPREDATYERLELDVEAATGAIHRTRVFDLLGNRTEVTFERVRVNPGLAPSTFRFETPEGVRELRLSHTSGG